VAAALRGSGEVWNGELGLWNSSAEHTTLDASEADVGNYGAWAVLGAALPGMGFDLRAGYADPDVTAANLFASATLAAELGGTTLGLGYARSALADGAQAAGLDAASVTELYVRFPVGAVELTLDLQHLRNHGFSTAVPDTRVGGVRLHYPF